MVIRTMSETDKPFACTSKGCQMTFTNEDHLNVHQKKHDMVLNLGLASKNNTFADQTPTPTRFIRNCEEVGLFQDLQNVNPFEETFRKAIEHSKTGSLHVPESSSDDTLHTPHIFPHITDESVGKFRQRSNDEHQPQEFSISNVPAIDEDLLKLGNKEIILTKNHIENVDLTNVNDNTTFTGKERTEELPSPCCSKAEYISAGTRNSSSLPAIETHIIGTVQSDVKEKIKVALQNKQKDDSLKSVGECVIQVGRIELQETYETDNCSLLLPKKPRKRAGVKCKPNKSTTCDANKKGALSYYDKNLSETEKRRAMNRIAQMKSRERKKMWMCEMEKEIVKLKAENKSILVENQRLKDENMLLKAILLNRNNCSLSKMEEIQTLLNTKRMTQNPPRKKFTPIKPKTHEKTAPPQNTSPQISSPSDLNVLLTPTANGKRKRTADTTTNLPRLLPKTAERTSVSSDNLAAVSSGIGKNYINVSCMNVPENFLVLIKSDSEEEVTWQTKQHEKNERPG